jgi:sigma-E factor negative regulatory protein RseC
MNVKTIETNTSCEVETIRHKGIVNHMDERFNYVTIVAQSACSSCHAKGACNVSGLNEEIIKIPKTPNDDYKTGQTVYVKMKKSLGTMAVMLGYFFPFLLVLVSLIVFLNLISSQGLAGLISLGLLVPYYLILYFFRGRLSKTFVFEIE